MCRHWLKLFALVTLTAGCSTPLSHEFYRPVPVETDLVRVTLREVQRGKYGGVVTLEIVNRSEDQLDSVHGARAEIRRDDGSISTSIDQRAFEGLIDQHGPIAMGLETYSKTDPAVLLDPLGARLNLKKDEAAVVYIGFGEPRDTRRLTIDLAPALSWRTQGDFMIRSESPIMIVVELPEVPTSNLPTKDAWRNVHFGIGISSDDVIR